MSAAAGGAGEMMMLRCVFEGSLSLHYAAIERRPYHKNCGCALHNNSREAAVLLCSNACAKYNNLSFPKKKSWPDCSFSVAAASKYTFSSSHQASLIYSTDSSVCQYSSNQQTRLETRE